MPKPTFYNLKEEKSGGFFQAMVQEFASHEFSEASLNRIVKTAKIPLGRFYQYFDNKEDLYLYIIKELSKYKWDALEQAGVDNIDGDFFNIIRGKLIAPH